jgi:uncharacterized protein
MMPTTGASNMTTMGTFIWHDLLTPRPADAQDFYRDVIGWRTELSEGPQPFPLFLAEGRPVGGIEDTSAEPARPPMWLGYVEVADVRAAAERARSLGATLIKDVIEVPTIGRYAVVSDPQGAAVALFEVADPAGERPTSRGPGTFGWAELNTTDWESAWQFYQALLGWKPTTSMDMGGQLGTYFMFQAADQADAESMGGMSNTATLMNAPAHWLFYATVQDIHAALERVTTRGGKVLNGPMAVPGGDLIAQCLDPQGGAFALHQR